MSRPVGRHRARRDTGIRALRRPAVAATAAISSVTVVTAAYATASTANASVAGAARANIAAGASAAAFNAANSGVAADAQAQTAAADSAVAARKAADAKARAAAAARATAAAKLQGKAASSAKAAQTAATKAAAAKAAAAKAAAARRDAAPDTSRSSTRPPVQTTVYSGNPQAIAASMLSSYGWGQDQMGCLVSLWNRESGWRVNATNPSSGAYGIPQSLPAGKMASAGADWQTNPATQIRWGLGYIKSSYGSPCGAWGHSQATGWY